jgi:hypothetical protein
MDAKEQKGILTSFFVRLQPTLVADWLKPPEVSPMNRAKWLCDCH